MENLTKLNLDEYKPLRDVVFENLRGAIVEGRLKPGQRLMEVQLAEQLGVANMSLKDLIDVLEIRASLEGLAASLAAERITDEDIKKLESIVEEFKDGINESNVEALLRKDVEFHGCIFKSTNNKKLHQLINSLWEQVYRFRVTYISDYDSTVNIIEEHKMILDAIKRRDSKLAKKYAMEHIQKAENFMIETTVNNKEL